MNTYFSACMRSVLIVSGFLLAGLSTNPLYANPTEGNVVAGSATITQAANTVTINQSSQSAIINWKDFSIAANETTRFIQPSANSIALNRVTGNDPSRILGNLVANGQIMLVNPNGIFFGKGSTVDVAGLIATTADITNENFMRGNYQFSQNPNKNIGIVNDGSITVRDQGLVALVAPGVENNGVIRANLGKVVLGSGKAFTIVDTYGDGLIQFAPNAEITQTPVAPDGRTMRSAVANNGVVIADGGTVILTANAAKNVVNDVVNMQGVVQANSVSARNGTIILSGGNAGVVKVSGKIYAKAQTADQKAGNIKVVGNDLRLESGAVIDASGGKDGFIETSGDQFSLGAVTITAGNGGTWLVDPIDLTIDATAASVISNALNAGTSVTELTMANGANGFGTQTEGKGDIHVNAAITWNSGAKLTLSAYNSININAPITITGAGQLELITNNQIGGTNTSGSINFNGGNIAFTKVVNGVTQGGLQINNQNYTLLNSVDQMRSHMNDSSDYFALANSYDAKNDGTYTSSVVSIFKGTFDGLGNTIKNLVINATDKVYVGLFGQIQTGGVVSNLGLVNSLVVASGIKGSAGTLVSLNGGRGNDLYVGTLAGQNSGSLSNVYTTGLVSAVGSVGGDGYDVSMAFGSSVIGGNGGAGGDVYVGGLVGLNAGDITNAYATGNVYGVGGVGGAGGEINILTQSYINAVGGAGGVGGAAYVGGLVGRTTSGVFSNVYMTGDVSGNAGAGGAGGNVTITGGSFNSQGTAGVGGAGNSTAYVGGLIGQITNGRLHDAYATGDVTGKGGAGGTGGVVTIGIQTSRAANGNGSNSNVAVGGVVGFSNGAINNVYSVGKVSTDNPNFAGGLVGFNDMNGSLGSSFWDVLGSGQTEAVGSWPEMLGFITLGVRGGCFGSACTGTNLPDLSLASTYNKLTNGSLWSISDTPSTTATAPNTVWFVFNDGTLPMLMSEYSLTIRNAHQLQLAGSTLGANYTLANDIDMRITTAGDVWGSQGFKAIGGNNSFTGLLNGNGYSIINLTINNSVDTNVGLFANNAGTIENLTLLNASVAGLHNVGGLVGSNSGLIQNVNIVTSNVSSGSTIGGLVGVNEEEGKIVGSANLNTNVFTQVANSEIGGLVGYNQGDILNAYSLGNVSTAQSEAVGGLVGLNGVDGTLTAVYADSDVVTVNGFGVGGLVGINIGTIKDAYSIGSINSQNSSYVGGFVGINVGDIVNTYSSGSVMNSFGKTGGFAGYNQNAVAGGGTAGSIQASFWDITTSGQTSGIGMTDSGTTNALQGGCFAGGNCGAQLNSLNLYQTAGWNIGTDVVNNHWLIFDNQTRPMLAMEYSTDISTLHQLQLVGLSSATLANNYTLSNNIDASAVKNAADVWGGSNAGFIPLGGDLQNNVTTAFTGVFDGKGYVVNNLYMNAARQYLGLFGQLGSGSTVKNLGLINANISGGTLYIGALAGINFGGHIVNSYADGGSVSTTSSAAYVGGLVGSNSYGGTIDNAYTNIAVTGVNYVGGLVGENGTYANQNGSVTNAYAVGTVKGTITRIGSVGGLIGNNAGGVVTNTYASGAVSGGATSGGLIGSNTGTVNKSFFDTTTTGQSNACGSGDCGGVIRGSTSQLSQYALNVDLKTLNLYRNYGWDIGSSLDNTWVIFDGQTRPMLAMEYNQAISTAHQLQLINLNATTLIQDYTLANNIDASGTATLSDVWGTTAVAQSITCSFGCPPSSVNSTIGFIPIGDSATNRPFLGTLNGQGYVIDHVNIQSPVSNPTIVTGIGLFGYAGNRAVIQNLGLTNATIATTSTELQTSTAGVFTGGLVGINQGTLYNVYDTVTFTNNNNNVTTAIGGLVGFNSGVIQYAGSNANITYSGTTTPASFVGGLVAYNTGRIMDAWSMGDIQVMDLNPHTINTFHTMVGGLVGQNTAEGIIQSAFSTANISTQIGDYAYVGGFVGQNNGVIAQAYYNNGTIKINANTEGVNGWSVGGFVGFNTGPILQAYSGGTINIVNGKHSEQNNPTNPSTQWTSRFEGNNNISATSSVYSNTNIIACNQCVGFSVSTTPGGDLTQQATFQGWDFGNTWGIVDGVTTPYFKWNSQVLTGAVAALPSFITDQSQFSTNVKTINVMQDGNTVLSLMLPYANQTAQNNSSDGTYQIQSVYRNGQYYFLLQGWGKSPLDLGEPIVLTGLNYGGAAIANAVWAPLASLGNTVSGLDLRNNQVSVVGLGSNTVLGTASAGLANSQLLYAVTGQDLTLNPGVNLVTQNGNYLLDGNITLSGGQMIFNTPVIILSDNPTLTTGDGNITFGGKVDTNFADQQSLTLNAGTGTVTFKDSIGKQAALADLSIQAANTILTGSNITLNSDLHLNSGDLMIKADQFKLDGTINIAMPSTTDVTFESLTNLPIYVGGDSLQNGYFTVTQNVLTQLAANNLATLTFGNASSASSITIDASGLTSTAATTALLSNNQIVINGDITSAGALHISAPNVEGSITALGDINVGSFNLLKGDWYQVAANLPAFSSPNDFVIGEGARFIRASGGTGASDNPYGITDIYGLQGIGTDLDSNYVLNNNIDAAVSANWNQGAGFKPIGSEYAPFVGSFNGAGATIKNLTIYFDLTSPVLVTGPDFYPNYVTGSVRAGLFGEVGQTGFITSVGLINTQITVNIANTATNTGSGVGALVGKNKGTVEKSFVDETSKIQMRNQGNLTGLGGLVGINTGTISNTYSLATVSGLVGTTNIFIGGLVGINDRILGIINTSYSAGSVSGTQFSAVDGFANVPIQSNQTPAYQINNSYWDTQTSGQNCASSGCAGTPNSAQGLTTSAMQTKSTFAGWDFDNVWTISAGHYPTLKALSQLILSGNAPANSQVVLINNGQYIGMTTASNTGIFSFNLGGNAFANAANYFLLYLNGGSVSGNVVSTTSSNIGLVSGLNFASETNTVVVNGSNMSNSALATALGNKSNSSILYSFSNGNLNLLNNANLVTTANTTYTVNSNIVGAGNVTFGGSINLRANVTSSGSQTYQAITLNNTQGNTTLKGYDIIFNGAVDAATGTAQGLSVTAANDIEVNGAINTSGVITLMAANDITLNRSVSSTAEGTAIVVGAGESFTNNAGSMGLNASAGRWILYAPAAADVSLGGLNGTVIYDSTLSSNPPNSFVGSNATNNLVVYAEAAPQIPQTPGSGTPGGIREVGGGSSTTVLTTNTSIGNTPGYIAGTGLNTAFQSTQGHSSTLDIVMGTTLGVIAGGAAIAGGILGLALMGASTLGVSAGLATMIAGTATAGLGGAVVTFGAAVMAGIGAAAAAIGTALAAIGSAIVAAVAAIAAAIVAAAQAVVSAIITIILLILAFL